MRQIPGRNLGKAAYSAQITILLAGIAAEEVIFGDHADGGDGGDDSDLHQATLIAATMEISLGLGASLVYLSSRRPEEVQARLQMDSLLRHMVAKIMDGCFQRAKAIIAEHSAEFDRIVRLLKVADSCSSRPSKRNDVARRNGMMPPTITR